MHRQLQGKIPQQNLTLLELQAVNWGSLHLGWNVNVDGDVEGHATV